MSGWIGHTPDRSTSWNRPAMQVSSCFWQTVLWIEGGDAGGVVGEDQSVAVITAAVILQGAAGVCDGVVCVNLLEEQRRFASGVRGRDGATVGGQVAGQTLVVHEYRARCSRVRHGVLSRLVSAQFLPAGHMFGTPGLYEWTSQSLYMYVTCCISCSVKAGTPRSASKRFPLQPVQFNFSFSDNLNPDFTKESEYSETFKIAVTELRLI